MRAKIYRRGLVWKEEGGGVRKERNEGRREEKERGLLAKQTLGNDWSVRMHTRHTLTLARKVKLNLSCARGAAPHS